MAGSHGSGSAARIAAIGMALLACVHCTMAASYVVGDSAGWNIGVDYKTWASQHSFKIGDTLQFKYTPALHSVFQTTEENYKTCTIAGRLQAYISGNDVVTITNSTMYFICPTPNHCVEGMALAITASGAPVTPISAPAPKSSPPTSPPKASPSPAPSNKSPSPSPATPSPSKPSPSSSPSPSSPAPALSPSSPESSPSSSPSPSSSSAPAQSPSYPESSPPSGSPPQSSSPPIPLSPTSPPSPPSAASTLRSGSIVLLSGVFLSGLLVLF